jgi:hypothetical protein
LDRAGACEGTFENLKYRLGCSDAANWKEQAVRRTTPMAGVIYSLMVAGSTRPDSNTSSSRIALGRRRRKKKWPSFAYMLMPL